MVELRLESTDDSSMPKDCFISVRVGETQKLSRLSGSRTYRFPQAGERRFGKIEVFKRIGACSVDIDPDNRDTRNVSVSCMEAGFGTLGLNINVEAPNADKVAEPKPEPMDPEKKAGGKVRAAKDYLSKHGLEVRLSEAMQAVLRERPEDPATFLAQKLIAGAKLPPLTSAPKLPADQGSALPEPVAQNKLEPLKQATPTAAPQVAVLPFKSFYKKNFQEMPQAAYTGIHARFAAYVAAKKKAPVGPRPPAILPFKGFYTQCFKESGSAALDKIHSKFPARNEALKKAAPLLPKAPKFAMRPSVGSWLMALPAMEPEVKPFSKRPSVGTWLTPLPKAAEPAAEKKSAAAAPAAAGPSAPFALMPSSGTWLAKPQPVLRPRTVCKRGLQGVRRPAQMNLDERKEVERAMTDVLLEMSGKLEGEYYPLQGSSSYWMRPGGMTTEEALMLKNLGILFEAPPGSDVQGRGVFCSASKTVAAQVNTEDAHVRFIVFKEGEQAQREMRLLEGAVKLALQQQGHAFA